MKGKARAPVWLQAAGSPLVDSGLDTGLLGGQVLVMADQPTRTRAAMFAGGCRGRWGGRPVDAAGNRLSGCPRFAGRAG